MTHWKLRTLQENPNVSQIERDFERLAIFGMGPHNELWREYSRGIHRIDYSYR